MGRINILFLLLFLMACASTANQGKALPVHGRSMEPLLHENDRIIFQEHYYDNHDVKRDDIIAYNYSGNQGIPIIKIVKAIPGDTWSLNDTSIIINGKVATNSQGKSYVNTDKILTLYTMYSPLPENTYMILGDNDNSLDSRGFGLIDKKDILGKIVIVHRNI